MFRTLENWFRTHGKPHDLSKGQQIEIEHNGYNVTITCKRAVTMHAGDPSYLYAYARVEDEGEYGTGDCAFSFWIKHTSVIKSAAEEACKELERKKQDEHRLEKQV